MENKCNNCARQIICKYADKTTDFEKKIKDIPDYLSIEIKCKYFEEKHVTIKQPLDIQNIPYISPSINDNISCSPCTKCDYYKNYVMTGKTYIGDSPCQWCSSNPFKITCSTTTTCNANSLSDKEYTNKKLEYDFDSTM